MADSTRRIAEPSGSPHDIAMMAYRIAERAMEQMERHERDCTDRWEEQLESMNRLRETALSNFNIASADRVDFREKLDSIQSFLVKTGMGVIGTLFTLLIAAASYIVLHH
jgi:hypothetical protein